MTTTTHTGDIGELVAELTETLAQVRLSLEPDGDGFVIGYERERHPVAALPLSNIDTEARRAELLAVAAGLDAAVKFPATIEDQSFLEGAPGLLPKVERRRFVEAYDAVVAGRGGGDGDRLMWRELGAELVVTYVREEGWRFSYLVKGQAERWEASAGTVDAAARSHLYARQDIDEKADVVKLGDHYDGARVTLIDDVFFMRVDSDGMRCAVPGRDTLLVGDAATPEAVAAAYASEQYPLSPQVLTFKSGLVTPHP